MLKWQTDYVMNLNYICYVTLTIPELQKCLQDIQSWMLSSKLKLNPNKTEFITFGSEAQHKQLSYFFPTNFLDNDLTPVNNVNNLDLIFDAVFSFTDQVTNIG